MAIYRTKKISNFTIVDNKLIEDKNLTLKEKGMMLILLRLPDNWEFSASGLSVIINESRNTTNGLLKGLEEKHYLLREPIYQKGQRGVKEWKYYIFETPDVYKKYLDTKNLDINNLDINNLDINNYAQINTIYKQVKNKTNTNTVVSPKSIQSSKFIKPSIVEIEKYIEEKGYTFNAEDFYNFYESKNWMIGKNKMSKWRSACATWNSKEKQNTKRQKYEKKLPNWFGKKIESEELTEEEEKEMKKMLEEIKNV